MITKEHGKEEIKKLVEKFMEEDYYNNPEKKARHELINPLLDKAGWRIQNYKVANPHSSKGVAVEYFQIGKDQADYILFVNGQAIGVIEAKKPGETLTGKEKQTGKYSEDFPEEFEINVLGQVVGQAVGIDNPAHFGRACSRVGDFFINAHHDADGKTDNH